MEIYTANNIKEIIKGISGIYRITNIVNGRKYYGQASCFKQRWARHITNLSLNKHDNEFFQKDFNKCGSNLDNLVFEIMEICPNIKEILDRIEQIYLDMFWDNKRQCYNIAKCASSSHKGLKHTDKAKQKMKEKRKDRVFTKETKSKMSKSNKGKPGVQVPERCITVYQYDIDGNFIKKHISLNDSAKTIMNTDIKCSKNIGMVRMCITITAKKNIILNKKNKTYTAYNFVWTYDYLGEKINVILHRIYTEDERKIKSERNKKSNTTPKAIASAKARVGLKSPNLEKVKQYDLNGNLIKIWNGTVFILNECKNVSRTNILRCKQRKIKSAGGYVWRFINDDF